MIEVWCDVGGTFTDCFVELPNQPRRSIKVLSSGIVKGQIDRVVGSNEIIDSNRTYPCDGFWIGARFHLLDLDGRRVWESTCIDHELVTGRLRLSTELPQSLVRGVEKGGCSYELQPEIEAPVLAARLLLAIPLSKPLPSLSVRLGQRGERMPY